MHRVCGPCEKSELATPKACPACGARITASSLSAKAPTLLRLEKETSTRGRLSAEWNLSRADFARCVACARVRVRACARGLMQPRARVGVA